MARDNSLSEEEFVAQCLNDFPDIPESEQYDPEYFDVVWACEAYYMNGSYDDIGGDAEAPTGHYYRIHRWIVVTDDHGFQELFTFDNEDEASAAFDKLEKEYLEWGDADDD